MTSPDIHHVAPPLLQLQSLFLKKRSSSRWEEVKLVFVNFKWWWQESNTACKRSCDFCSYSCRDGDGDGSFCSKVNYRANICSITSPMRPKRGWKDPLHSTNVNRYVTIIFTKLWRQSLCYKVNRNSTLIFRQIATFVLSFANNRRIFTKKKFTFWKAHFFRQFA